MGQNESSDLSRKSLIFLDSLKSDERGKLEPFLGNFELACILSEFEDALLTIPYDVKEHKSELEGIFNFIRQTILARLGQKILFNAINKNDKTGSDSANVLIRRLSGESAGTTTSFTDLLKEALRE